MFLLQFFHLEQHTKLIYFCNQAICFRKTTADERQFLFRGFLSKNIAKNTGQDLPPSHSKTLWNAINVNLTFADDLNRWKGCI